MNQYDLQQQIELLQETIRAQNDTIKAQSELIAMLTQPKVEIGSGKKVDNGPLTERQYI